MGTLYYVAIALAIKRGRHRPTTLCKEGLTWECTIATLVLVGWSILDQLQSKKEEMAEMARYWIALIYFGCSGTQATVLLEALVLMANLVDLMVGSIQLGLVSKGGMAFSFNHLLDLTNLLKQSVERTGSTSSIESIT